MVKERAELPAPFSKVFVVERAIRVSPEEGVPVLPGHSAPNGDDRTVRRDTAAEGYKGVFARSAAVE
jgi:6,7-dimethyl-8-ribityllumazine synthase